MRVSCIIPTRNRPEMTCRAIASVLGQEEVFEIVVVDDGSTDHTAAMVADNYPQVTLVRLSGLGPGLARNAGVAASTGEVIMFLDSDDQWLPGHSEALLRALGRGYQVAYGVGRNLDLLSGGEFLVPEDGQAVEGDCLEALSSWCFVLTPAVAVTRDAFARSGGFGSGDLAEDWIFYIRLASHFPFGFAGPKPIFLRHLHGGSLCRQAEARRIDQALAGVELALLEAGVAGLPLRRFREMRQWTRNAGEGWASIQQWYQALRQAGLAA
ncbi:MAG: glycosyltransferase family 2 protein [Thermodesulfobacteriota bacterium]